MSHFQKIADDPVFRSIFIDIDPSNDTTIYWELHDHFNDPLPYTYNIEYNPDFSDPAGWRHFLGPIINQVAVTGPRVRLFGKTIRLGFRIALTTPKGTYQSFVANALGQMTTRQWLQAKAAIRRLSLTPRNVNALQGILLKRKWKGPRCVCTDDETEEITDITCQVCYGTGIVGGYWKAGQHRLVEISPYGELLKRSQEGSSPMIEPMLVSAIKVSIPPVHVEDVWVRLDNNRRFYVRSVRHLAELGGIPVISQFEMGPADFDDIIYNFPIN